MGLRKAITGAVDGAFKALGDIPEQVTIEHTVSTSYSIASGQHFIKGYRHFVTGVFHAMENAEVDGQEILSTDVKFIFRQNEASVLIPQTQDTVHRLYAGASVDYSIEAVEEDPAQVIWELVLRRKA